MLALAGALAMAQRCEDADVAVQPAHQVGHADADLARLLALRPGDRHDAAGRLDDEVDAAARRVRAAMAEAGERAIDQTRKFIFQIAVGQAVFRQRAGLVVLEQDIALRDHPPGQALTLRRCQVDRDRALVAVRRVEIDAVVEQFFAVCVLQEGRAPAAHIVAGAGTLDLDDVGAEVGQDLGRRRPGQDAGQVENAESFQRTGHAGFQSGCGAWWRRGRQGAYRQAPEPAQRRGGGNDRWREIRA